MDLRLLSLKYFSAKLLLELTDAFPMSGRTTYERKQIEKEKAAEEQRKAEQRTHRNKRVAIKVRGDDLGARELGDELTSADDEERGNQTTGRSRAQSDNDDRAFSRTPTVSAIFQAVTSAHQIYTTLSPMITSPTLMSSPQDASTSGGQALEIDVLKTSVC